MNEELLLEKSRVLANNALVIPEGALYGDNAPSFQRLLQIIEIYAERFINHDPENGNGEPVLRNFDGRDIIIRFRMNNGQPFHEWNLRGTNCYIYFGLKPAYGDNILVINTLGKEKWMPHQNLDFQSIVKLVAIFEN